MKKELTLSEVIEYFKDKQIPSFEEEIDEYGGYLITAARLAAVILAPSPLVALSNFCAGIDAASLRVSKLFSWLPDKFKYPNKGRENEAIHRYKTSSIINVKLLDIAIMNSFKDVIAPIITELLKNINIDDTDKLQIQKLTQESENIQLRISIDTFNSMSKDNISIIACKVIDPLLPFLIKLSENYKKEEKKSKQIDFHKLQKLYVDKAYTFYNAFLINFSSEFPEFTLWCDIREKNNIKNELSSIKKYIETHVVDNKNALVTHENFTKSINELLQKIEVLREDKFIKKVGLPTFDSSFSSLFAKQTESIIAKFDEKVINNIVAHQNLIKSEIEKPLSENDDIDIIRYPKNKDIYVAQSFQAILYKKKEHKKGFLTSTLKENNAFQGEDIGKYLLQKLIDPSTALKPLIILGNPGAGKSMFSKMFAAKLCATNDFIPFLIRLRDVASSSSDVAEHINKGISKSINNTQDINWIDWAKLFKDRVPVIILDGFDELMQSSNTELNGYINKIKDLQESALHHDICLRVILTSRITVMQDVSIPDGTNIIKLDSFDEKRKMLWVEKWNSFQVKEGYKFVLPKNDKILELAQEPLLLFMLAVYDFPAAELQGLAQDKSFNQSKLYDSLLNDFGLRQLEKEDYYLGANREIKKRERELFRLRLGMIAFLMFLNDTTNKDIQRLEEELKICKLDDSEIKPIDVLTGFFFVHQNKATSENEVENFNYEFLHKSFGEFLAADFLLRIAFKQKSRDTKDEDLFQVCFGYNWLHKHPEIQKFLFEHASQVFNFDKKEQEFIVEQIQYDLCHLFDKTMNYFPVAKYTIIEHKSKIEHIAIYSQNLMFLWMSLCNFDENIEFKVMFDKQRNIKKNNVIDEETVNYNAQDREEQNRNKLLWKRITNLWQLVGNYQSVAKLNEWVEIIETEEISLRRRKDNIALMHNFSDAASISCNDFNFIIALFDNEYKFPTKSNTLSKIESILKNKPELTVLANDALIHRFTDLMIIYDVKVILFLLENNLISRQFSDLIEKFLMNDSIKFDDKLHISEMIFKQTYNTGKNSASAIKLLRSIIPYSNLSPVSKIFSKDNLDQIIERIYKQLREEIDENIELSISFLKLIDELKEFNPLNRIFHSDMINDFIDKSSRNFRHILREKPQFVIEYFKLLRNIKYTFNRRIEPHLLEESLERILLDVKHNYHPHSFIRYLKLTNELKDLFPLKKIFQLEMIADSIERFSRDLAYIAQENPRLALDSLKLLKNINDEFPLNKFIFPNLLDELIGRLIDVRRDHRDNTQYFTEYLMLINEFIEFMPSRKVIDSEMMYRLIHNLNKDLIPISRDYPLFALEYLKLIKNCDGQHYFIGEIIDIGILEELIRRIFIDSKEFNRGNPHLAIKFLKLINELRDCFPSFTVLRPEMIQELIHRFNKELKYLVKNDTDFLLEYLKLTINSDNFNDLYEALEPFPELQRAYRNNPNEFVNHFNSFSKMFNYESRN